MDTAVATALTSIAGTVKTDAIETYVFIIPIAFGIYVAIWAIKFGYGKLVKAMKGKH